ncbi:sugar transferase [Clostridium sp. chh4-2]|uniref:sugar transferase n=1 Tax=Clostridium sp. chh4-2 TaxID=2067550 RepID=UPI000CCE1CF1|nr:sugar transferase [Clostridium sp. chh4-2]PNV60587.1 sugar transferase [Clostridium sp. chh4-2]
MLVKNKSFYMLLDVGEIIISFVLAIFLRYRVVQGRMISDAWFGCILMIFVYVLVVLFYQPPKPLMKRNNWEELQIVLAANLYMALLLAMILYLNRAGTLFPRSVYIVFFVSNTILMYIGRFNLKKVLRAYYKKSGNRKKLLICANRENLVAAIDKFVHSFLFEYEVIAVVEVGKKGNREEIRIHQIEQGIRGERIVLSGENLKDFLKHQVIDEALLCLPYSTREEVNRFIVRLETMGIETHVAVDTYDHQEKAIERLGAYRVLTYSPRIFEPTELFIKRVMDVVGGIVGSLVTVLLCLVIVPAIHLESPGPAIFKQVRIGRNGRRFCIYKFRSMYMDAEERKKELMKKNEMKGLMFKIKDDPRITKVGKFLRKTSLDEFPQFFNVLKGDMSLVGTRPPTEDEFLQYEEHHKRRLSLKPGITGLWQVSGRSDIHDFEEVVSLDLEYIDKWSIWLDIRLLIQTVYVVLFHRGAS